MPSSACLSLPDEDEKWKLWCKPAGFVRGSDEQEGQFHKIVARNVRFPRFLLKKLRCMCCFFLGEGFLIGSLYVAHKLDGFQSTVKWLHWTSIDRVLLNLTKEKFLLLFFYWGPWCSTFYGYHLDQTEKFLLYRIIFLRGESKVSSISHTNCCLYDASVLKQIIANTQSRTTEV